MTAKQPQITNSITAKQPQIGSLNSCNQYLKQRQSDSGGVLSETEMLDHQLPQLITNANPNPVPGSPKEITTLQQAPMEPSATIVRYLKRFPAGTNPISTHLAWWRKTATN
jgi:hypothetical protein